MHYLATLYKNKSSSFFNTEMDPFWPSSMEPRYILFFKLGYHWPPYWSVSGPSSKRSECSHYFLIKSKTSPRDLSQLVVTPIVNILIN